MSGFSLNIDGRKVAGLEGQTILQVALAHGIDIPHLCYDPRLTPTGACRLCLVEIEGEAALQTSCTRAAAPGMVVRTATDTVREARRASVELLLSEHRVACTTCDKDGDCLLQDYAYQCQASETQFPSVMTPPGEANYTSTNKGIVYDPSKCVRCQRCVKICAEVVMAEALTLRGRAMGVQVSTAFDVPVTESTCELCGQCIDTCPTGALYDRTATGYGRAKELVKVRTTCTYCGVGCQYDLNVNRRLNRIVRVTAEPGSVPNDGNVCVKGRYGMQFVSSPDRLTTPLIRENGAFREASWEEALALIGRRMREIRDQHGPDSVAVLSSSRCTNEENYLAQKLARTAFGTNNIDQCATTCHAPSVAGLALSLGSGAMTNSIGEIKDVDTLFLIGANPTEAHPIVGFEMKKALRRGAKLVVCDPRKTWMARRADIHIQHRPGTDNFLVNAMMKHIVEKNLHDPKFIETRCEGFDAFRENLKEYSIERAAEVCGVDADLIRRAAEMYARGTPSAIFYTLGITEHTCGTENVQNLANLTMLCGQIGKPSSGINPLRGQNNVQGACDMGAIHSVLPGYQRVTDPAVREKFGKAWNLELPTNVGGRVTDYIEQAGEGILRGFYVMGEDPVLSEPNQDKVAAHLQKLEFLVCQEIFMTETAKLAHVVLPGACFAEKDGTFSNTERRVQRVRKAVEPPGSAKPDWEILCLVSTAMGHPLQYRDAGEVFDEMAALTPSYAGISYARIDQVGIQWPCPTKEHPGTKYLHAERFTRGRGLFHAIKFRPPAEIPDADYPFILSTGRTLYHYNIGNMTMASATIRQKERANFVELHVTDAQRLGVADGGNVRVTTRRGSIVVAARVADRVRPGSVWMPFHFVEAPTNRLTNDAFDNITRTAEYKCCAAKLEPAKAARESGELTMKNLLIIDTVSNVGAELPKAFRAAGWQVHVTATPPPAAGTKPVTAIVLAATGENLASVLPRTLALRIGHTPPVVLLTDLDRSGWDRTFEAPEALDVDALFDLPADADAVLRRVQGLLEAVGEGPTRAPSRGMRAIIDRAVANEVAAAEFYKRAAAATAHPETRDALLSLAQDEVGHERMLQQFKEGTIRLPEASTDAGQLLEHMRTPELSADMSPADAFLLAARKEKLAVEFYRNWAALYAPGPERTLLEQLADMEQQHKVRLEDIFTNASFPEVW